MSSDGALQRSFEAEFNRKQTLLVFRIEEQLQRAIDERGTVSAEHDRLTKEQHTLKAKIDSLRESIGDQQARRELEQKRAVLKQIELQYNNACEQVRALELQRNIASSGCEQIQIKLTQHASRKEKLDDEEKGLNEQKKAAESRQAELKSRLQQSENTLADLSLSSDEGFQARAENEQVEVLRAKAEALEENLKGFEEDVRSPEVLADHEAQQTRVETVRNLVGGKQDDAAKARDLCERARADYHEYLKRFGERLAGSFRETCSDCGAEGELGIRGLAEDRPYLHVAVAHNRGERLVAYRETPHSGGQRAKISMLLLIAAMGLDGSTDFMVLDEPTAHMSGNVIRQVNQLLENLVHTRGRRVQFMFAVPTKGENEPGALSADQQILFFLRRPGEPFNPPVIRMIGESALSKVSA